RLASWRCLSAHSWHENACLTRGDDRITIKPVPRALGIWAKKGEIYLAVAEDGQIVEMDPQRIQAPAVMEASERLSGFLVSLRHALGDLPPERARILQPESNPPSPYGNLAPKIALETAVRVVCDETHVPVEVLHRAPARSRLGLERNGTLDRRI